jgi:hypothetical protein
MHRTKSALLTMPSNSKGTVSQTNWQRDYELAY